MVIFDLEDLEGARSRALALGVRVVWQIDLPDISGTHLHPADMRGAIVSLDRSKPYGSWRWGGPQWTGRTGSGAPGRLAGITVAVADPAAVAARWADVLGVDVGFDADGARAAGADGPLLALDGGEDRIVFDGNVVPGDFSRLSGDGPIEVALADPSALVEALGAGGVHLPPVAGKASLHFVGLDSIRLSGIEAGGATGDLLLSRSGGAARVTGTLALPPLELGALLPVLLGPASVVGADTSFGTPPAGVIVVVRSSTPLEIRLRRARSSPPVAGRSSGLRARSWWMSAASPCGSVGRNWSRSVGSRCRRASAVSASVSPRNGTRPARHS